MDLRWRWTPFTVAAGIGAALWVLADLISALPDNPLRAALSSFLPALGAGYGMIQWVDPCRHRNTPVYVFGAWATLFGFSVGALCGWPPGPWRDWAGVILAVLMVPGVMMLGLMHGLSVLYFALGDRDIRTAEALSICLVLEVGGAVIGFHVAYLGNRHDLRASLDVCQPALRAVSSALEHRGQGVDGDLPRSLSRYVKSIPARRAALAHPLQNHFQMVWFTLRPKHQSDIVAALIVFVWDAEYICVVIFVLAVTAVALVGAMRMDTAGTVVLAILLTMLFVTQQRQCTSNDPETCRTAHPRVIHTLTLEECIGNRITSSSHSSITNRAGENGFTMD